MIAEFEGATGSREMMIARWNPETLRNQSQVAVEYLAQDRSESCWVEDERLATIFPRPSAAYAVMFSLRAMDALSGRDEFFGAMVVAKVLELEPKRQRFNERVSPAAAFELLEERGLA